MSDLSPKLTATHDWFNPNNMMFKGKNRRTCIRYIRRDIGVFIKKTGLFSFSLFGDKDNSVKLIDIGSKGTLIASTMKLEANDSVLLTMRFADFKEFEVPSKIIWKADAERNYFVYGVKFDQLNERLAEHLLITQRKLNFK